MLHNCRIWNKVKKRKKKECSITKCGTLQEGSYAPATKIQQVSSGIGWDLRRTKAESHENTVAFFVGDAKGGPVSVASDVKQTG